jgi:hypothetical protein
MIVEEENQVLTIGLFFFERDKAIGAIKLTSYL